MTSGRLTGTERLAGLRADRSAARLAQIQAAIDVLETKASTLRDAATEAPASVAEAVMRDKWDRWRTEQLRVLNHQIARLQMVAQPQREAHARDNARRKVIEKLAADALRRTRRNQTP